MSFRQHLYGTARSHNGEKARRHTLMNPAFTDVWSRNPELHPAADDSEEERMRKADERERLILESMVVSAIDMTVLPNRVISEELRRVASLLESLDTTD